MTADDHDAYLTIVNSINALEQSILKTGQALITNRGNWMGSGPDARFLEPSELQRLTGRMVSFSSGGLWRDEIMNSILQDILDIPFVLWSAGLYLEEFPNDEIPSLSQGELERDNESAKRLFEELRQTAHLFYGPPPQDWEWMPSRDSQTESFEEESLDRLGQDFKNLKRECVRVLVLRAHPEPAAVLPEDVHRQVARIFRLNLAPRMMVCLLDFKGDLGNQFMQTALAKAYFARPVRTGSIKYRELNRELDEVIEFLECVRKGKTPRGTARPSKPLRAKTVIDRYKSKMGLSWKDLARKLKTTDTVLYALRRAEARASKETIERIAKEIDCSPDDLLPPE
jgi:hypothetical protein